VEVEVAQEDVWDSIVKLIPEKGVESRRVSHVIVKVENMEVMLVSPDFQQLNARVGDKVITGSHP